jgi:NADPH:quinone reductase-like Zn-dependent oxidoreductase
MKNHRVVVTRHGGPEVLQVVAEELPEPQAGEVRVKVLAAGISAYDLMLRRSGALPGTPAVPHTPGEDVVGVVDKLGDGVSAVEPGQRVIPLTLLTVVLLNLMPGGKRASMSSNLAEFAPAHHTWYRETLTELLDLLAAGEINPAVAERIPLVEAARAHELIERGGYAGKVVLVPSA